MIDVLFDSIGKGVTDFKVGVSGPQGYAGEPGTRINLEYWIHTEGRSFNPELTIYLTPEQTIELYEKLGQYILDRNLNKTEEIA